MELSIHHRIYYGFHKNIKQHNYDNIFFHKTSILECFFVTLKTGVMKLKFSFAITGINYIWKYTKIENSYFKL